MKKRIFSFVLAVLMIASLLPAAALAADVVASGTCGAEGDGSNLTWTLNSEGTLTISGTGKMKDYEYYGDLPPWFDFEYSGKVKSLRILNGVTSIGSFAFCDCWFLSSVSIPNSVTSIGNYAFSNCKSLTSAAIPNSVTSIGNYAFVQCYSLTSMTIPKGVMSIGESTFYDCRSLTSVTIPGGITSIGNSAFGGCDSLTSVTIPGGVRSIGESAFSNCASLTSVTVPNSVTSIGNYAFSNCTSLTNMAIPKGVTSIGMFTFTGCTSLTSVTIPNGVTSIGTSAFAGCTSLTNVTIPDSVTSIGEHAFSECSSLTSMAIPHGMDEICKYTFSWCSALTSVTIPDSVTSIGEWAFFDCKSLTDVYYAGSAAQWKAIYISCENDNLLNAKIHYCSPDHGTLPTGSDVDVTEMFSDVTKNWAYPGIQYCVTHQLMSGVGSGRFAPKMTTTRAQIVQILYNLEGEPKVSGTMPFTDLTQNWYKDAVLWAYQTGVVVGTSATTFEPDRPVTREQIAVILMEYVTKVLKLERTWTPADLSVFPDAGSVSDWAKDALADAVALGLISGASNGGQTLLEPQGSATREQVATILMEFCKNVKK